MVRMNIVDIYQSVEKQNMLFPTQFYQDCLRKLNRMEGTITAISEDKHILEAVRLHATHHNYYHLYIGHNDPPNSTTWRTLSVTPKGRDNIFRQLFAIEKRNLSSLCSSGYPEMETLIVILSSKELRDGSLIEISKEAFADSLKLLLGIESIKVAEHQDLIRFCRFMRSSKKEESESTRMFEIFLKTWWNFDEMVKTKSIIFSGAILHSLGTTYTQDMDIIYYGEEDDDETISQVVSKYQSTKKADYAIIHKGIVKKEIEMSYMYDWYTQKWPQIIGVNHIKEVLADPEHHFHFMGLKLVSVEMTIAKLMKRAMASAFVDLIMLKRVNGYKIDPCFPNLSLRQGKIVIYNDREIKDTLRKVSQYFRWWHGIEELKNEIKRCDELPHKIYAKKPDRNPHTSQLMFYHNQVMKYYMGQYLRNTKLLDVGAGPLRNIRYYDSIGIRRLVGIEPSAESIREGLERKKEVNALINVTMIEGYGDTSWKDNPTYKVVMGEKPYDAILFKFTIHYMIREIDQVVKNIEQVDKEGTVLMISCLDGNMISSKLAKHRGRYEVFVGDEPLYGIYDFDYHDGHRRILVYFKGVYGVEQGSIEYLIDVNKVIHKFQGIGYKLIENRRMVDTEGKLKGLRHKLNKQQYKIAELHRLLIMRKV